MTEIFENGLRKSNMIDNYIKNAKKNLSRKIERSIPNVNCINVRRKLYIYPDSIEKNWYYWDVFGEQIRAGQHKSKSNSEKDIVSTALMMRENKNTKRYYALASWCTWRRYIKNKHH